MKIIMHQKNKCAGIISGKLCNKVRCVYPYMLCCQGVSEKDKYVGIPSDAQKIVLVSFQINILINT